MSKKKLTADQIAFVAQNIMTDFIPKNEAETEFSFYFTAEGTNCKASCIKLHGKWELQQAGEAES